MLTDRHYTPQELAAQWNCSSSYIRRRFRAEPGVIKVGRVWRIPESVAVKVYRSLQVPDASVRPAKMHGRLLPTGIVALRPRASRIVQLPGHLNDQAA